MFARSANLVRQPSSPGISGGGREGGRDEVGRSNLFRVNLEMLNVPLRHATRLVVREFV